MTKRGARMPRIALPAAYVLPGWARTLRDVDSIAFGACSTLAGAAAGLRRRSAASPHAVLLPHWLGPLHPGAVAVGRPGLAARVLLALLLTLVLMLTWYSAIPSGPHRRSAAGGVLPGEAEPVDYARGHRRRRRAGVDRQPGFLQLGHEKPRRRWPSSSASACCCAMACGPYRRWRARLAAPAAFVVLAGSGAPSMALAMGLTGHGGVRRPPMRRCGASCPGSRWPGGGLAVTALAARRLGPRVDFDTARANCRRPAQC